ncbi:hypothetical protein EI94DRAFT_1742604 [Lactarius quietus]|nr:hypothetical protein EI94DRAFT_1742604 [Lactarius quietus]
MLTTHSLSPLVKVLARIVFLGTSILVFTSPWSHCVGLYCTISRKAVRDTSEPVCAYQTLHQYQRLLRTPEVLHRSPTDCEDKEHNGYG